MQDKKEGGGKEGRQADREDGRVKEWLKKFRIVKVISLQPVKTKESWFWDYLIGFHVLQFLYWLRFVFEKKTELSS